MSQLICPHCDRALGVGHDDNSCRRKSMTRRVFFGLFGASTALLMARLNGIPIPWAGREVRLYKGDRFLSMGFGTIKYRDILTVDGFPPHPWWDGSQGVGWKGNYAVSDMFQRVAIPVDGWMAVEPHPNVQEVVITESTAPYRIIRRPK